MHKLVVALFQKPASGRRPIGFFQSPIRMTSRWHSRHCKEWEKKVPDQGVFSMAPGCSAVDTVWRQQIRGDLAVAN
eukprot:7345122-Pyramimonas_sp.AAC.1